MLRNQQLFKIPMRKNSEGSNQPHQNEEKEVIESFENPCEVVKHGKNTLATSAQYFSSEEENLLTSRSKKRPKRNNFEISFEENILKSHCEALINLLKKFSPHEVFYFNSKQQSEQRNYCITASNEEMEKVKELLEHSFIIPKFMVPQFLKDLQREANLANFLVFISRICPGELASELMGISYQVWEKYLEVCGSQLWNGSSKFLNKLLREIEEHFQDSLRYELLLLQTACQKSEPKQDLRDLFLKFAETIYLVIEEYFDNPYAPNAVPQFIPQSDSSQDSDFQREWEQGFAKVEKKKKTK